MLRSRRSAARADSSYWQMRVGFGLGRGQLSVGCLASIRLGLGSAVLEPDLEEAEGQSKNLMVLRDKATYLDCARRHVELLGDALAKLNRWHGVDCAHIKVSLGLRSLIDSKNGDSPVKVPSRTRHWAREVLLRCLTSYGNGPDDIATDAASARSPASWSRVRLDGVLE